ncbi:MAG: redox-regulated ATPase YchF [Candidatus Zixiibacteriota bacterium]|nr:MAG: redox-regulated ATPase YchF [candidate division Zixibacteria bacterium]
MRLGIIGLPQSGKTTLFNAVSGLEETVGDYSQAVHRAVIKVPDERLDNLAGLFEPEKVTHAEIEFLDAAAFTGKGKRAGEEPDIMHDLRTMDAVVIVIDDFSVNAKPEHDLRNLIDEMILADLVLVESNLTKLERSIKLTGKKERAGELEVLKKCHEALNNERSLSVLDLTEDEKREIRGYSFLTLKPQLIVFNVAEDKLPQRDGIYESYKKYCIEGFRDISVICGKIEMELAALEEDERGEFLRELNIDRLAVDKFIQKSYGLLGLISFFTVLGPECRAWTIKEGTTAHKAAGVVHTDFERGFIKAEVAAYDDYMEHKTVPALKAAARLHVEGKGYVVRDGDVILFRFNV